VDFAHISTGSQGILEGCDRLDRGGKLRTFRPVSGSSSAVERQLPKLDAVGSIPISRSSIYAVFSDIPPILVQQTVQQYAKLPRT
jgi:hypothetical protein